MRRRGRPRAEVVGLDLSGEAIGPERRLADEVGLSGCATLVETDVYDVPRHLGGRRFDVVFTSCESSPGAATCEWNHPLGEIVTSLMETGLELEHLHDEFPYTHGLRFPFLEHDADGSQRIPRREEDYPLSFSLRARKPPR